MTVLRPALQILWWVGALTLAAAASWGLEQLPWFDEISQGLQLPIRWGTTGIILVAAELLRPWRRVATRRAASDRGSGDSGEHRLPGHG